MIGDFFELQNATFGISSDENSLHSPGATAPVAIVEVESLALQDKGANAVLMEDSRSA